MIEVVSVGKPWTPADNPQADPLWTIVVKGQTEPQKTYDAVLATVGQHEAEQYTAKSGKTYWRTPKGSQTVVGTPGGSRPGVKKFEADPKKMRQEFTLEVARNLSIQRQVALKGTVDLIVAGKVEYNELVNTFTDLMTLLNKLSPEQIKDDEPVDPDLPPIDSYDDPPVEDEA